MGNAAPSRCDKSKKRIRKVDKRPSKDPREKIYANLSSSGRRASRKTPKANPSVLEMPFAADLLAVVSFMSASVKEPYTVKVKKVLMKEEEIKYAEYSIEINRLLVVRGINSHIILSSA